MRQLDIRIRDVLAVIALGLGWPFLAEIVARFFQIAGA